MEHKFTNDEAKKIAAFETLQSLGYTWQGGQLWKPPLGQPPAYIVWDGEGLPPVGAETKYRVIGSRHNPKWLYARILYISDDWVVFADDKGVEHCEPLRGFVFRRYVSPEERKQNAVNAMRKVVESASLEGNTTPGCLDALYAALIAGEIPGLPGEEAE